YLMNKDREISTTAYAREELDKKGMDRSQNTGASSSYARKYALNGLFDIDDAKDSDTTNSHEVKPNNTTYKTTTIAKSATDPDNEFNNSTCKHCGAKIAISTNGKPYCVNMCWLPENKHFQTEYKAKLQPVQS